MELHRRKKRKREERREKGDRRRNKGRVGGVQATFLASCHCEVRHGGTRGTR